MKIPRRKFLKAGALFLPCAAVGQVLPTRRLNFQPSVSSCSNSTVTAWAAQVVTNGGSAPSAGTQSRLCTFVNGCISDGVWSKLLSVITFETDSLTAAFTPLLATKGNTLWVNHNFVSGDLTINGLLGDGNTKYLETGIVPSTDLTLNSTSLVSYEYSANSNTLGGVDLGAEDTTPQVSLQLIPKISTTTIFDAYNYHGGQGRATATSHGAGYYCGSRTASNASAIYYASSGTSHSAIATISTSGGSLTSQSLFSFAQNDFGDCCESNARISFQAIGLGLTSTDSSNLFNRVQALLVARGGGFV